MCCGHFRKHQVGSPAHCLVLPCFHTRATPDHRGSPAGTLTASAEPPSSNLMPPGLTPPAPPAVAPAPPRAAAGALTALSKVSLRTFTPVAGGGTSGVAAAASDACVGVACMSAGRRSRPVDACCCGVAVATGVPNRLLGRIMPPGVSAPALSPAPSAPRSGVWWRVAALLLLPPARPPNAGSGRPPGAAALGLNRLVGWRSIGLKLKLESPGGR